MISEMEFTEKDVEDEIEEIENSKPVQRLQEKTQVLVPMTGRNSIVKNRLTHSYEVSTSTRRMVASIAERLGLKISDIDYKNCIKQVCLLHDIGHPPFGHDGQEVIDKAFKAYGLEEGFNDNNNNLVVIESNNLKIRDYVKASVIKYPEKLYDDQKIKYNKMLEKAIQEDKEHFQKLGINLKDQKTTITCQLMDEGDRNSYTCSDLTDFFSLGNDVKEEDLLTCFDNKSTQEVLLFKQMVDAIKTKDNRVIRSFFSDLKKKFNDNFQLGENGLEYIDEGLYNFRESLSKVEYDFFITPIRKEDFHLNNMKMLDLFVQKSVEDNQFSSKNHKKNIDNSETEKEKLISIRDMVSEVSDWFIIKQCENIIDKSIISDKKIKKRKPF